MTIAGFAGAMPAAATVMERQGLSAGIIGITTSFIYAGVLCMAPFQPRLAGMFGAVATYQIGKVFSAAGSVGLALSHTAWAWSLSTLLIGFGAGLTWPVTDGLLAAFAPEGKKGAWMGMFQTAMGAAFAVGPFIAAALPPNVVFIGSAAAGLLSSLPLFGQKVEVARDSSSHKAGLWTVFGMAPELPVLAFLGGFFENGTHSAITLSALALSWQKDGAIALAGVIGAGGFAVLYPVGKLADSSGARRIIVITLLVMIAACLPLPLGRVLPSVFWVTAFVWGAAGGCLYTLAMTGMAQRFAGDRVMTATTMMVMSYTVGGIVGPAVAGYAVDWAPLFGPLFLFVVASVVGILLMRIGGAKAGGDGASASSA